MFGGTALLLAACAQSNSAQGPVLVESGSDRASVVAVTGPVPGDSTAPSTVEDESDSSVPKTAAGAAAAGESAAPGVGAAAETEIAGRMTDPHALVGLAGEEVAGLLGKPALVRRDEPAEIWQYRGSDCVLDLYLYPPAAAGAAAQAHAGASSGPRSVVYVEMRGKKAEPVLERACLELFLNAGPRGRPG